MKRLLAVAGAVLEALPLITLGLIANHADQNAAKAANDARDAAGDAAAALEDLARLQKRVADLETAADLRGVEQEATEANPTARAAAEQVYQTLCAVPPGQPVRVAITTPAAEGARQTAAAIIPFGQSGGQA